MGDFFYSRDELKEMVVKNDVKALEEFLDTYRIYKEGVDFFSDEKRLMLSTLFIYASVRAKNDELKEGFSNMLIENTAYLVNLFDFIDAMLLYLDCRPVELEEGTFPPKRLIDEMHRHFPNDSIYTLTKTMSRTQFLYLCQLMADGEFYGMSRKCAAPILLYCYNGNIIPHDICLAYIATCFKNLDNFVTLGSSNEDESPFGDCEEAYEGELDYLSDMFDAREDPEHSPDDFPPGK